MHIYVIVFLSFTYFSLSLSLFQTHTHHSLSFFLHALVFSFTFCFIRTFALFQTSVFWRTKELRYIFSHTIHRHLSLFFSYLLLSLTLAQIHTHTHTTWFTGRYVPRSRRTYFSWRREITHSRGARASSHRFPFRAFRHNPKMVSPFCRARINNRYSGNRMYAEFEIALQVSLCGTDSPTNTRAW